MDAVEPAATTRPRKRLPGDVVAYLVVGVLSVLVDVGLLVLLREAAHVLLPVATTVAFAASVLVNFVLNRAIFGSPSSLALAAHALRYALLVAGNCLVTVVVVTLSASAGVSYIAAKFVVVCVATVWNYWSYRTWVFA